MSIRKTIIFFCYIIFALCSLLVIISHKLVDSYFCNSAILIIYVLFVV